MNSRSRNGAAYLAALSYAAILGFSFLFVKLTVTEASPLDVIAHRFALSFIALTIPVLLGWIKINIKMRDILRILPLALLAISVFSTASLRADEHFFIGRWNYPSNRSHLYAAVSFLFY